MEDRVEFFMYRATVHPHPKEPLFASKEPKPEILRATIMEAATATSSRGGRWHVGNVAPVGTGALSFRLGRLRNTSISQLNSRGDFIDADVPEAPNSFAVVDIPNEIVAIARNTSLAPSPGTLGRCLALVLTETRAAKQRSVMVEVAPIKNPVNFLQDLRNAFAVSKLWVVTKRPNPFDAERMWVQPMSRITEELSAESAKTTWTGPALQASKPEITDIINSTAANGGDAGATVRDTKKSDPRRIKLRTNLASFSLTVEADGGLFRAAETVLVGLRDVYRRIRHGDETEDERD